MQALTERDPDVHFRICTRVPEWFFAESLSNCSYHEIPFAVRLVQTTAMEEDLDATAAELNEFLPFSKEVLGRTAAAIQDCDAVLTDVTLLGIAVARKLGVPVFFVENFTWDWIFNRYTEAPPQLREHAAYLRDIRESANYHIRMDPFCEAFPADLVTHPIAREPRRTRQETRLELGVGDEPLVLVSMGGVRGSYPFLKELRAHRQISFMVPGAAAAYRRDDNLILTPQNSGFYHPDLMQAADAVICKAGYSTLAEAFHAGIPVGYMLRQRFPESPPFAEWIPRHIPSREIAVADWESGRWVDCVPDILALGRAGHKVPNGADEAADFVMSALP